MKKEVYLGCAAAALGVLFLSLGEFYNNAKREVCQSTVRRVTQKLDEQAAESKYGTYPIAVFSKNEEVIVQPIESRIVEYVGVECLKEQLIIQGGYFSKRVIPSEFNYYFFLNRLPEV